MNQQYPDTADGHRQRIADLEKAKKPTAPVPEQKPAVEKEEPEKGKSKK